MSTMQPADRRLRVGKSHRCGVLLTAFCLAGVLVALPRSSAAEATVGQGAAPKFARPLDATAQALPFAQDWSNTGLITTDDDWSGVPGILGYRGDDITTGIGVDPQTLLADGTGTPIDVNANQTNPNTFATGGLAEFHISNPAVALNGSGTADAPFMLLNLNTTGACTVNVAYNARDLDGSADDAVSPIATHYRVGNTGNFTNLPAGYIADATTGPNLATLVTAVSLALPAAANNQSLVQVRVMTTNAAGNDEWVGIDDISVTGGSCITSTPTPTNTPTNTPTDTGTPTPTNTPTNTPTDTGTPTPTNTPTDTGTPTPTNTPTNTPTDTGTPTPTNTPTNAPTNTATNTPTITPTIPPGGCAQSGSTVTCLPVADARTSSGSPSSNFGSSTYLRIRTYSPAMNQYLRFNVVVVTGTVQSATLRLFAYDGTDVGGSVYSVPNTWLENTINWLNQPALTGTPLVTLGAVPSNTWAEYSVTSAVTGNGLVSFGMTTSSADSAYFHSREATVSQKPQLVITLGP
jgi:hypothetical protein